MAEVTVLPSPIGGWCWTCTTHGAPFLAWVSRLDATFDAIGHAAAHHPPAASSE